MGRDEQCGAMQGWDSEGVELGDKMNANGSVCLKGVCAYVSFIHSSLIRFGLFWNARQVRERSRQPALHLRSHLRRI